jgi:hypothetical protein
MCSVLFVHLQLLVVTVIGLCPGLVTCNFQRTNTITCGTTSYKLFNKILVYNDYMKANIYIIIELNIS